MLRGLMQDHKLVVSSFIDYAALWHGDVEVVTLTVEGGEHRYTWSQCAVRAKKVAQALSRFGIREGDRVGTLAWNTYRHVELWYGISGMGAVSHTINPRLFPEQITYIVNHAEDRVLFVDLTFLPIIEALGPALASLEAVIVMTDEAHMPQTKLENVLCYETFVQAEQEDYDWPDLDENAACGLCYTSGTTGDPKGVLYSHRSNVLHTLLCASADTIGVSNSDAILPIVPMFHANSWGIPYMAAMVGAKLVMQGPHHDGETLHGLIIREGVTITAAVPTIWIGMLEFLRKTDKRLDCLKNVIIGGSAAPRSMIDAFERDYGVTVNHAWGMTELSPVGTIGSMTAKTATLPWDEQLDTKCKQGRGIWGVEMKIVDDEGNELPRDGEASGNVLVRGPWIANGYFKSDERDAFLDDNWMVTGDVATIDPAGYMQITDRAKDVIKSGGEWISSIDLENAAVGHPEVLEAAVIGIHHPKWDERPLLILVAAGDVRLSKDDMNAFLEDKIAKWWLPDDVVYVDEIPHTATGKILKTALREQFKDFELSTY